MPIKIPDALPAHAVLESENIFVMTEKRAMTQDIRPLRIVILNLMPTKVATETQLLRRLSNTPLQIEIDLLHTTSHVSKNTSEEHLSSFYKSFDQIRGRRYDGMIITGAPVENLSFEEVDYWPELCDIFDWAHKNVFSVLNICWAAQAALLLSLPAFRNTRSIKKCSASFDTAYSTIKNRCCAVLMTISPRRTPGIPKSARPTLKSIRNCASFPIPAVAGVYIVMRNDGREFYVTGHSEYDADTLARSIFATRKRGWILTSL